MAHIDVVALPGDGIGPEVTEAVTRVLAATASACGHEFTVRFHDVGWAAYERHGTPLPDDTLQASVRGPAVFLGAVGDPRADGLSPEKRPEAALLRLRRELGCFANLRPAKIDEQLLELSPLKAEIATGTDLVIVRELTGASTTARLEVSRLIPIGPSTRWPTRSSKWSGSRVSPSRRLDAGGVDSPRSTRPTCSKYPNCGVPWSTGLPVTTRTFRSTTCSSTGQPWNCWPRRRSSTWCSRVTSSETSSATRPGRCVASLGLLGSASVGGEVAMYEPVHGSAPDIAGQGIANPIGGIRSASLMLSHSFDLEDEAEALEDAVTTVLGRGLRTRDLVSSGDSAVSTLDFADAVAEAVAHHE